MTVLIDADEAVRRLEPLELPEEAGRLLRVNRFRHEAVARVLFERCDDLAFTAPKEALKLAELVPRLVDLVPPEHCRGGRVVALKGEAMCVYGTALRAAGHFRKAEDAYLRAELYLTGEGSVLERAELALRRSTLYAERREFDKALPLADEAVDSWRRHSSDPHLLGRALLVRASHSSFAGRRTEALRDLGAAITHLVPERSSRLFYAAAHNLACALLTCATSGEELADAAAQIGRARAIGGYPPDALPSVRLGWAEGRIWGKLGEYDKALAQFRQCAAGLERHGTAVDMILLALDVAEVLRARGAMAELQRHAADMRPLIRGGVRHSRNAHAALVEFQRAVSAGGVGAELIADVRRSVEDCGATEHGPVQTSRPATASRYRLELVAEPESYPYPERCSRPSEVARFVRGVLEPHQHREVMGAVYVDHDYNAAGHTLAYFGGVRRVRVEPRELLVPGLLLNAAGLILFHNHPGASAAASRSDVRVTEWLRDAGEIVGVRVLDHIVVSQAPGRYTSLRETGAVAFYDLFDEPILPRLVALNGRGDGRSRVRPKYRDPANPAHTWAGRGTTPKWMRPYLGACRA